MNISNKNNTYISPFSARYGSKEMRFLFSPHYKHTTWRKLWYALAKAQQQLGLPITDKQLEELYQHRDTLNFEKIQKYEESSRHEVMAHIHAYGEDCPQARSILHLGATSAFVMDNTDLIQMREGLFLLKDKLAILLEKMHHQALNTRNLSCLAYTHFQIAQPTTMGKRFCLWLQDFSLDLGDLIHTLESLSFLGAKGATGTQASFMQLFDQQEEKVLQLDVLLAKEFGFTKCLSISSQTYPRKQDARIFHILASIASSAHKFATDLRLLSHLGEMFEPRLHSQVGSSAMPHKKNPMLAERICALSRFIMNQAHNGNENAALQWLERSLDDSANRRLIIPELFLACDTILDLLIHINSHLVIDPKRITSNLQDKTPYVMIEGLLMLLVQKGKDRQTMHEELRSHIHKWEEKKLHNFEEVLTKPPFSLSRKEIQQAKDPEQLTGRARSQVIQFLKEEIQPLLKQHLPTTSYSPKLDV